MNLESSHERIEQERPRLVTAAETDHSPAVEGDSGGEQLPANVTSASVLLDSDDLVALLQAWVGSPDWSTSQTYLQTHPELLTDGAAQVLATLTQHEPDLYVRERLAQHQLLLQTARQHGVEGAYEFLQRRDEAESASNDLEELENQLIAWLQTPDWNASQTYLQAHPHLLTERAEQVLEQLKHAQLEEEVRSFMSSRQTLLHQARTWEIAGVYAYFQLAEQAATIDDHKQEALLRQLGEWLAGGRTSAADWEQEQVYLEEHPSLLTTAAESLLAVLWPMQETPQQQVSVVLHLQLLQLARVYGITAAYRRFPDAASLNNAGIEAINEYLTNGGTEVLEQALECWQQALFLTLPDSPDRPDYLTNLGNGLIERYMHTGVLDDLKRAITVLQQAVDATPPNSPDRPDYLTNLGNGLSKRYAHTGVLDDLERAITLYQQAVDATPPDSPDWPRSLSNLGGGLRDRYAHTGVLDDLERAITLYQQAVDVIPPDSPDWPSYLTNLGGGLYDRYRSTGVLEDLERAIAVFQQAVDATPPNFANRAKYLTNLGGGLHERYAHTGVLDDLEKAITLYQQAVDATPPNSPDLPSHLTHLGNGLRNRYARTGVLDDLERAIAVYQQAMDTTPSNSPSWPGSLTNLGNGLRDRYASTGVLEDLERAITLYQQAMDTTPSNSPSWPAYLNNLGLGLHDSYRRTGVLEDLERAITLFQQAMDTTPSNSPSWPGSLNNLGLGLYDRYRRTGVLDDLERAIAVFQQAVDATPPNSPDWPAYLKNLGGGFYNRYRRTGVLDDLERAITDFQQAVDATSPNSPDWPGSLTNLGSGLQDRYSRTGVLDDLERAIAVLQQAVDATPPNSPDRPGYLTNLGSGLQDRYRRTGVLGDLEKVITTLETNWSLLHFRFVGLPIDYQLGQQRQSTPIAASLVIAYLERSARHRSSAQIDRCRALEVAEGSKSRLLTQLVGRGPLALPTGLSPEVAAREQHLLSDLTALDTLELAIHDRPTPVQQEAGSLHRLQQRQADLIELEGLWDDIARLGPEGTEYAALRRGAAPTWQELTDLAQELGRATALLSFFSTPDHVLLFLLRAGWHEPRVSRAPLNAISWDDLLERFFREVHLYVPSLRRRQTWDLALHQLLTQTQRHLAGVERLILTPAGYGHLLPWSVLMERVGWRMPSGQPVPLVTLPALGVLPRLQRRPQAHVSLALVVGNPTGDLPYAEDEASEVAARFGTAPLLGSAATKEAVLSRLAEVSLIHLATHAFFDPNNPLESGIVLADGVLTAREVLQHRLQANLLVLSACESGQVGSLGGEELAGLSQAFLQAGVRSLLVSLWQVNDPATAALMQAFYTAWQAGADKALALRQAMTHIQQYPRWTHPYYWGAFVLQGDWD